jgi:hypothetical protein
MQSERDGAISLVRRVSDANAHPKIKVCHKKTIDDLSSLQTVPMAVLKKWFGHLPQRFCWKQQFREDIAQFRLLVWLL